jgi:hypothetical protein
VSRQCPANLDPGLVNPCLLQVSTPDSHAREPAAQEGDALVAAVRAEMEAMARAHAEQAGAHAIVQQPCLTSPHPRMCMCSLSHAVPAVSSLESPTDKACERIIWIKILQPIHLL